MILTSKVDSRHCSFLIRAYDTGSTAEIHWVNLANLGCFMTSSCSLSFTYGSAYTNRL